jgi:acyl-ACP thioesterase
VRWHDLDFNLHLNNTYYILYLLEGLPADWLSDHSLKRLDIVFKSEVRMDETFSVQVQQLLSGQFLHRMIQGNEERLLAEMTTEWA